MTLAENQLYRTTEISGESHSFYVTRFKDGPFFADQLAFPDMVPDSGQTPVGKHTI